MSQYTVAMDDLAAEVERLRKERDKTRRMILLALHYLPDTGNDADPATHARRVLRNESLSWEEQPPTPEGQNWVAFGADELGRPVTKGDLIDCPHCGEKHTVQYGKDPKTGEETSVLQFYTCGTKSYLCGVKGQRI